MTQLKRDNYPKALPIPIYLYTDKNSDRNRHYFWIALSDLLNGYTKFIDLRIQKKIDILTEIEKNCFVAAINDAKTYGINCVWNDKAFVCHYQSIGYRVLCLLDHTDAINGSIALLDMMIENKINYYYLVTASPSDLCPEKYKELIEMISLRSGITYTQKETTIYTCRKCKHQKTSYRRIQQNCNDEASKNDIKCLFCGYKWVAY